MPNFRQEETPSTAMENLAIALGFLIASPQGMNDVQLKCYIESVVVLGKKAGLERRHFDCFDITQKFVNEAWEKYS